MGMFGGKDGGSSSGVDPAVQAGILQNETALTRIAQQQASEGQQLFNLTEPGLRTAETFYQTLAAGDPGAIMRATSPAAQQISESTEGAKANIMRTVAPGGEKNLALEMADVAKGSEIGKIAAGSTLNAPNALAGLAGQGIGESISATGQGIGAYSAGTSALGTLGGFQLQEQQIMAQNKGASLGAGASLAQDAAMIAMFA